MTINKNIVLTLQHINCMDSAHQVLEGSCNYSKFQVWATDQKDYDTFIYVFNDIIIFIIIKKWQEHSLVFTSQ